MSPPRTYALNKLYHQFLKPKGVAAGSMSLLVTKLYEARFIEVFASIDGGERYSETEKLTSGDNNKELFKLIQTVIDDSSIS